MDNKILNKIYFFVLISAFFFACNDTTNVGIGLISEDDLIASSTNDTLEIEAYTHRIDSTITSSSSYAIIGSYLDPVFGYVRSSFVTQTKIVAATDFSNNPVLDSIVLHLRYKSTTPLVYGNTSNDINIQVYEIAYNLSGDSTYYSNFNQDLITKKSTLANITYSYANRDNDSILSIKLSNTYGQKILSKSPDWTDANFNSVYNGIWIKSDDISEDAALTLFDISSPYTKVTLYYKNSSADSLSYDFAIDASCIRMNLFNHDYSSGNILTDLSNPESQQDTVIYVQGLQGVKSKILIPELDVLKSEGNWAVNRAELVVSAANNAYTYEASYPAPSSLSIFGIDDEDKMVYLDQYLTTDSYLGVIYSDSKYSFDITHRVQQILKGTVNNNGFYLLTQSTFNNPSRVVLGGANHENRMKLVLTLTKI